MIKGEIWWGGKIVTDTMRDISWLHNSLQGNLEVTV